MKKLMWFNADKGIWVCVREVADDIAEKTLKWFAAGHPLYRYRLEDKD